MKFVVLTESEYIDAIKNIPNVPFYQKPSWALVKNMTGWDCSYVGVKKKNKVIGCSLLLIKKVLFNQKMFYAPRGLLIDYSDEELLSFFTNSLKDYVKKKQGYVLIADPLVCYKQRDRKGNVIEPPVGFDNSDVFNSILSNGWHHKGFTKGYSSDIQFRWSYILDVKDKTFDDLLKDMNQRCRRSIKKSELYPLVSRFIGKEDIQTFKDIMMHTSLRQNHADRSIEYYLSLVDCLGKDVKLLIIYLDRDKYLSDFKDDKLYDVIKNQEDKLIPLSCGLFILEDKRVNYVYGGSYSNYLPLMSAYKLQTTMIKYAIDNYYDKYDFGGITGCFDKNSYAYGTYEFKYGFGGNVVEYLGEFELIVNRIFYSLNKYLFSFYKLIKKVIK